MGMGVTGMTGSGDLGTLDPSKPVSLLSVRHSTVVARVVVVVVVALDFSCTFLTISS